MRMVKPGGERIVGYVCRRNTIFQDHEMRRHGTHYLAFERKGWKLVVPENGVVKIGITCNWMSKR